MDLDASFRRFRLEKMGNAYLNELFVVKSRLFSLEGFSSAFLVTEERRHWFFRGIWILLNTLLLGLRLLFWSFRLLSNSYMRKSQGLDTMIEINVRIDTVWLSEWPWPPGECQRSLSVVSQLESHKRVSGLELIRYNIGPGAYLS